MLWNKFPRLHECKICPLLTFGLTERKRTSRKHAARGPKARCQRRGGATRAGPPALSPSRRYRTTRTCARRRSVSNCRGLVGSSLASVDHLGWSACRAGMREHRARRHTCTAHNPVCRRLLVRRGQRSGMMPRSLARCTTSSKIEDRVSGVPSCPHPILADWTANAHCPADTAPLCRAQSRSPRPPNDEPICAC